MLVLTVNNKILNTDTMKTNDEVYHSVLKLQDPSYADFYMEVIEYLDEFSAAAITLRIGEHEIVMPLHWSIICTDMEYLQSIPLSELGGRHFPAFCLNPIDGFAPEFLRVRTGTIFPQANWTSPQVHDKDILMVPLGDTTRVPVAGDTRVRGPICAMFSASKVEVYKPIGDIW
jgi:hypothetical protein